MSEATREWLDALKPQDEIALDTGSYSVSTFIKTRVLRLTATQVVVADPHTGRERRFRKQDGREVGGDGGWSRTDRITPLTPAVRERIETAKLKAWIGSLYQHHTVRLSLRVMRAMKAAHDAEIAAEKAEAEKPATEGAPQ